MKVILLSHVKGIGQKGQVIDVSNGYFQNFLLPRHLAVIATASQVTHIQNQQVKAVEKLENMKESASAIKARIDGKTVTITEKVSESGKLYAALKEKEIRAAILAELKVDIPEKQINLPEPIKSAGGYQIEINLFKDVKALLNLDVKTA